MRRLAALSLALLTTVPVLATEPLMPPHVVAETFCMARTVGDMSLVEDEFSSELYQTIGHALLKNAEQQKAHPDEKPFLGDGIPYASYPDRPDECLVDYEGAKAHPTEVAVTYKFAGAPDAGWTDTLILRDVDGKWELDDVMYADGGRLVDLLQTAFP